MAEIIIPDGVRYHLYAASVGQTAFAYTFPILSAADIGVKRLRAGVSTRLTLDTDYSVSGAGTQPGGTVTLTAEAQAGDIYALFGDETGERITDFVGETFSSTDINAELDRIAQALLDLRRTFNRRIGVDETDDATVGLTLPPAADRANKVFAFSSTGAPDVRASTGTELFALADAGPPSAGLGVTGDLALGTDGLVWSKASGSWVVTTINLRGATGPAGSVGTLPDGTPAAPGLAYGADTNTGYHRPAADTLAEVVGGVEKVRTTATGLEILTNSAFLTLPEHATAAATPAAGKVAVYGKANGRVYAKDAGGRETMLANDDPGLADFRLTLTSGTPVLTADTTGTTLYLTPFRGNRLALWNTTESLWEVLAFAEQSIALSGLTAGKTYDVFVYLSAGTLTFDLVAWTNDTTRATAIAYQDGVPVKTGALDRRLIGTFRALSATQIEWKLGGTGAGGVAASLGLWHANPKVRVPVKGIIRDSTDSWSYGGVIRAANNSAAMRVNLLDGDGTMRARADYNALVTVPASSQFLASVGLDSTSAFSAYSTSGATTNTAITTLASGLFSGPIGLGWHYLQALEGRAAGAGSGTWYGDVGNPLIFQTGYAYEVMV